MTTNECPARAGAAPGERHNRTHPNHGRTGPHWCILDAGHDGPHVVDDPLHPGQVGRYTDADRLIVWDVTTPPATVESYAVPFSDDEISGFVLGGKNLTSTLDVE